MRFFILSRVKVDEQVRHPFLSDWLNATLPAVTVIPTSSGE
jgi:hypothetical protein